MTQRIVKAVVVSPKLSEGARQSSPEAAGAEWLSKAKDDGVTLFLTAISEQEIADLSSWYAGLQDADKENIRLLTPARFFWPGGIIRMPFEAATPEGAAASAAEKLNMILDAKTGAAAEFCESDGYLAVSGPRDLSKELLKQLWDTAKASEPTLSLFDPDEAVEAHAVAEGRWLTILGPDKPSVIWFEVITVVERFSPVEVAVIGDGGDPIDTLRKRFDEAREKITGDNGRPADAAPQESTGGETLIYAPRLAAPSLIHFIKKWSERNRRYVRESYWLATTKAHQNLDRAQESLRSLDPGTYARAAKLVELAGRNDGARVFDDFSGAVCFAPGFYEFELSKQSGDRAVDNLVADLLGYFDEKFHEMPFDRPLLKRRLFSNSLVLLRGEGYYANLKQTPPWERAKDYMAEADALEKLFRKCRAGGADFNDAFEKCIIGENDTVPAWKLLLAAFDQARNLGLIMLGVGLHLWRESDKKLVDHNLLESSTRLIDVYYQFMLGDRSLSGEETAQLIIDATIKLKAELNSLQDGESNRAKTSDWYEPGRPIRGWREADNPYENLLIGLLASESIDEASTTAALGVFWGGTELPLSTRIAAKALGKELMAGFVTRGRYSSASEQEDDFYCDLSTGHFAQLGQLRLDGVSSILLLDDNALSGQTLESARDLLLGAGLERVETWAVRFSGERREGQMRMANSGIVHPAYLCRRLKGYLGETPYARSYSRKQYASPVGVFNTARSRILRYLHNNGFASVFEREGF